MTADPVAALRERARERGRSVLSAAPWAEVESRATLLLVDPPAVEWAEAPATASLWLLVDAGDARTLPRDQRTSLLGDGIVPATAAVGGAREVTLTVYSLERLAGALRGVGRRALEMRWSVRHAEPLHDPLRRHDEMAAAAARLPEDALERIARGLYLQAHGTLGVLEAAAAARAPGVVVMAGGEAAGALARLACVLDDGMHPPARWLDAAARRTRLGQRVAPWLDDLPGALGGDEAAARRIAEGCDAVLRAAAAELRPQFESRDWLRSPEAASLPGRRG